MAKRPIEAKRAARLRRSITKGTLPAYIDLVEHIRLRTRCTRGIARRIILAGMVRVDSHSVGFKYNRDGTKVLDPRIPAEHRGRVMVTADGV